MAIEVENLTVRYEKIVNRPTTLKELAVRMVKRKVASQDVIALSGVSFSIEHGEVYGIIGRNGAGKSTLLKVLSRIIPPSSGRVITRGRITPLLGVGAGFHQELSGRENLFLYSALLGRTRNETKNLFDQIVEFSDLQKYIDSPIRIYSTGMVARLGFSVAMATQPDILLVDEVLSVGDEEFKNKCRSRFAEFRKKGATILFVSHSLPTIQELCTKATWIHEGRVNKTGKTDEVISAYKDLIRGGKKAK